MFTINKLQYLFCLGARVEKNDSATLEKLPSELKERLASFLSTRDLLNLAETSKSICSDLNLAISSSPLTDRASQNQFYRSILCRCFAVVIPSKESLSHYDHHHSMTFTCKVENHGVSYAGVSIVEQELPVYQHPEFLQRIYRYRGNNNNNYTMARSSSLMNSKLSLSFPVKPNKFYQLYINTNGNESDDFVALSDMSIHRVGFSTTCRNTTAEPSYKAYQFDLFVEPSSTTQRWIRVIGG